MVLKQLRNPDGSLCGGCWWYGVFVNLVSCITGADIVLADVLPPIFCASHFGGGKFRFGGGVLRTEVLYCLFIDMMLSVVIHLMVNIDFRYCN